VEINGLPGITGFRRSLSLGEERCDCLAPFGVVGPGGGDLVGDVIGDVNGEDGVGCGWGK
jgi:hypothetical protein